MYLKEIGKIPILSAEEERILAEEMEAGSIRAKKKLAETNLRLVVSIAKRYVGRGMQFRPYSRRKHGTYESCWKNLISEEDLNSVLYATWWIRQAITRSIADQARTIRIPGSYGGNYK